MCKVEFIESYIRVGNDYQWNDNHGLQGNSFKAVNVMDKIRDLPSAQQWIPCSERMPECDYTDVLICVHDKRKGCEKDYYIISAYTSGKHWEPTLAVDMTDFDVVAWMPLPEPYKGDANG